MSALNSGLRAWIGVVLGDSLIRETVNIRSKVFTPVADIFYINGVPCN